MQTDEDSPLCRRCQLPISAGHAYELGGDRWHMVCFSCLKCGRLLGTSSNFMVLGNGDLVCSECSYSCFCCGRKIDDLAILTGEQAYCSQCFQCRHCKKAITDLQYARTSKGLFCMSCHEKLLARKKRHDALKNLPALPPVDHYAPASAPAPVSLEPPVEVSSQQVLATPKKSPLRSSVNRTPNGDVNRKAVVMDSVSTSSLDAYANGSPLPLSVPPELPFGARVVEDALDDGFNDDFIDMNDTSDNDEEEEEEEALAVGSVLEVADPVSTGQYRDKKPVDLDLDFDDSTTPIINQSNITSPMKSPKVSRSKSIKSPKMFLNNFNFNSKHKKSESASSIDYKISSPFLTNENINHNLSTPRQSINSSNNTASFQTPPIESNHQRHYSHSSINQHKRSTSSTTKHLRSKSDINSYDGLNSNNNIIDEKRSLELELRILKIEIMEMKQTKNLLTNEINELNFKKNSINQEILSMSDNLANLKFDEKAMSHSSSSSPKHLPVLQQNKSDRSIQSDKSIDHSIQIIDLNNDKKSKKFWKRNIFKSDNLSNSQSSYSIHNLINEDDNGNNNSNNNNSNNNNNNIKHLISEPFLKNDEIDELGGNDNKKISSNNNNLLKSKLIDLQNPKSEVPNNSLIMSDLFNSTLEMRSVFEKRPIPLIITRLVEEVEKRGLELEGIYRKNGGTLQMNSILNSFNNLYQSETSFELEKNLKGDINALTSSLKRYLYFILPEPIIPNNLYEEFIKIDKLTNLNDKINSFKSNILINLSITNFKTLKFLLNHFNKIEQNSNLNKMNFYNLSVVFGPTFTRVNSSERELLDMKSRNNVMEFLLRNSNELFQGIER